jgi:hypothetical protein
MADLKISQLTEAELPFSGSELIPVVQDGTNKKVAFGDLELIASSSISSIVTLTQSEYDAIETPNPTTLYIVAGV